MSERGAVGEATRRPGAEGTLRARLALLASGRKKAAFGHLGILTRTAFLIAGLVLLTFVLGVIGWEMQDDVDTVINLSWPAIIHRTLALFVLDSSGVVNAPWPLEVARLLAPVAGATLAIDFLITKSADRLHRAAARTAKGHHVLVGPVDRVRPYLAEVEPQRTVHAIGLDEESLTGVLRTRVDWSAGFGPDGLPSDNSQDLDDQPGIRQISGSWIDLSACKSANRVVLASGDDEQNLQLLANLLAARLGNGDTTAQVIVEIQDPDLVPWLSLALAHQQPDADVEFVCWQDTVARRAAMTIDSVILHRTTQNSGPPSFLLLGDSSMSSLIGSHIAHLLARWHEAARTPWRQRPITHLLESEAAGAKPISSPRIRCVIHTDFEDVLRAEPIPWAALVLYSDTAENFRIGTQLRYRHPDCDVFVPARAKDLAGGLKALSTNAITDLSDLEGPFSRIARHRHERIQGSCKRNPTWDELSYIERRDKIHCVRCIVNLLGDNPRVQLTISKPDELVEPLPTEVAHDLEQKLNSISRMSPCKCPDASELALAPYWFREGGLGVTIV